MPTIPDLSYANSERSLFKRSLIRLIENISGKRKLNALYEELLNKFDQGFGFWDAAIKVLGYSIESHPLPALTRPTLIIANHPYGFPDGLTVCHLAHCLDPDFKILINSVLCQEPRVAGHLLPIDFSEQQGATRRNIASMREAINHLRNGHIVAMFPAGAISTRKGFCGEVIDWTWNTLPATLIQASKADVLPLFFYGQNSFLFQTISQVSMTLRLALILHEISNTIGLHINFEIGEVIAYERMQDMKKEELVYFLRQQTYSLRGGSKK